MPRISELGHVGLHCLDVERSRAFYEGLLGIRVTDENPAIGMVFLSAKPDYEHHELLLMPRRTAPPGTLVVQQVSFRTESLQDVIDFYGLLVDNDIPIEFSVTHGNAIGVYFFDPDGNRVEIYWDTGLTVPQPYLQKVDLTQTAEDVLAEVKQGLESNPPRAVDMSLLVAAEDRYHALYPDALGAQPPTARG